MSSETEVDNESCEIEMASANLIKNEDEDILIDKEQREVEEHDLSSDSADEFESYIKCRKNELMTQTKEQKQKHNEEIVIATSVASTKNLLQVDTTMPSSSMNDSEMSNSTNCKENNSQNHFFIDASSLLDESELCTVPPLMLGDVAKVVNNKLTKLKIGEASEYQEQKTAEFHKEIKVSNSIESCIDDTKICTQIEGIPSTSTVVKTEMSYDYREVDPSQESFDELSKEVTMKNYDIENTESRKCNFVRSGTFELETESEETIQRKTNERRQGLLVFQNSIKQFSTHNLGAEPSTPHNSIIHINDTIIINSSPEGPLDSVFYENPVKNITEVTCDLEIINCEDEDNNYDDTIKDTDVDFELKPIKREESVPIISGGVCTKDLDFINDSNGGACSTSTGLRDIKLDEKVSKHVIKTAWVVDMSTPEPSLEHENSQKVENAQTKSSNKSSLGYYIDFNDIPNEKDKKPPVVKDESEKSNKKNIFSMCIDFQAPKKGIPSRLSQSLYAKRSDKQNESTDTDKKSVDTKNDDAKKTKPDISENGNIEKHTVLFRHKRSSSNGNMLNRHSWNSSSDFNTHTSQHQRTYSLSATMKFPINNYVNDHNLVQSEDENTLQENVCVSHVEIPPIVIEDDKPTEVETKTTKSDGFVSLSDLDKPVTKNINIEQPVYMRMTRSIPETSWIENKLLMSRSIGCRTSSKLLTNMSNSTPSNIYFSNNTYTKVSGQDSDELLSELSDFSSIQSSTALGKI